MKRLEPRDYQHTGVVSTIAYLKKRKNVLLVSPGGSGKTVMIAMLAARLRKMHLRVLILAQRRELIQQAYRHLQGIGLPDNTFGVIMTSPDEDHIRPGAPIQIGSKQLFDCRTDLPTYDVVLVDEGHHVTAPGYQRIVMRKGVLRVGFTATPERYDGAGLSAFYDVMIETAKPRELVDRGYLARPRIFTTLDELLPDLSELRPTVNGDYAVYRLGHLVDKGVLLGNIVDNYALHASGLSMSVHATNVAHSRHLVDRFVGSGVTAAHIDGDTSVTDRDRIVRLARQRRILILSSCMVFSEGISLREFQGTIMARPTRSLTLYMQQANRAMHHKGKDRPIILDHARNVLYHGRPDADREFTLEDGQVKPQSKAKHPPVKVCGECNAVNLPSATACEECEHPFHASTIPQETDAVLREMTLAEVRKLKKRLAAYGKKQGWSATHVATWVNKVLKQWWSERGLTPMQT
jgi:superfamily II DNA or RNA helicase